MIQNNSRGFFDHGFQVEYAVHANEEGKKDIGIFVKMEVNIGVQENWDLHWIMHSGVISQRLLIER